MRPARRQWLHAAGALGLALGAPGAAHSLTSDCVFALIGDLPYSDADETRLGELLTAIGQEELDFVLHVGDLKGSREPCEDTLYDRRIARLAQSRQPLLLLPGDNDWTDCTRTDAEAQPLERLEALRERLWRRRLTLGGRPQQDASRLGLIAQPQRPENQRWRVGPVQFVSAHVVGSGNARRGFEGAAESFEARMADNRAWVLAALDTARRDKARALAIAFHAHPDWAPSARSGFAGWIELLREVAESWSGPLLLLHGDSHRFRVDRPLQDARGRTYPQVLRVESFGWPMTSQWVRIAFRDEADAGFEVSVRSTVAPPWA